MMSSRFFSASKSALITHPRWHRAECEPELIDSICAR
jgi:hypothetical protein